MALYQQIHHLMDTSDVFLISTMDTRGFPTTIAVSAPLNKRGIQRMEFYLNATGETVENILREAKGAVCFFNEATHQSLLFKGKFSLRIYTPEDAELLTDYQRQLNHQEAVIAVFETMICKSHIEGTTTSFIF